MARKRHSDEDILKLLREIELHLAGGADVATACRAAGISDATYYNWRKKFGGMGRSQLSDGSFHGVAACATPALQICYPVATPRVLQGL